MDLQDRHIASHLSPARRGRHPPTACQTLTSPAASGRVRVLSTRTSSSRSHRSFIVQPAPRHTRAPRPNDAMRARFGTVPLGVARTMDQRQGHSSNQVPAAGTEALSPAQSACGIMIIVGNTSHLSVCPVERAWHRAQGAFRAQLPRASATALESARRAKSPPARASRDSNEVF